jgi:hypothetical protein
MPTAVWFVPQIRWESIRCAGGAHGANDIAPVGVARKPCRDGSDDQRVSLCRCWLPPPKHAIQPLQLVSIRTFQSLRSLLSGDR